MTGESFNQEGFQEFILEHNVVKFFEETVTLNSGRKSNFYVSWRRVADDVYTLDKLTDFIVAFVRSKGIEADSFFGVPEGATGLALILDYKHARQAKGYGPGSHAFAMGRGKPKEHGNPSDKYFIGMPKGRTIIVEDTTTTGKSVLETLDRLREAGVSVDIAIALINRNEKRDDGKTVTEALKDRGVQYYAMSDLLDILPEIFRKTHPGERVGRLVEDYFKMYGEREVKLVS